MRAQLQHLWSSSLKIGKLTFTLRPLPVHTGQLLSLDTLIKVNCWELQSLPRSALLPPEEGELPEVSLGNCGLPCHLHQLLPQPAHWEWVFLHSGLWLIISPFLTSTLVASYSKPPHPLFNVVCYSGGLSYLHHSMGTSWPPGLSSLFHYSIHNSSVTLLYGNYSCLYLCCPTSPIDWACQAESNIPGIPQGESFFEWLSSKK